MSQNRSIKFVDKSLVFVEVWQYIYTVIIGKLKFSIGRWLMQKLQAVEHLGLISGCLINQNYVHVNNILKLSHTMHAN